MNQIARLAVAITADTSSAVSSLKNIEAAMQAVEQRAGSLSAPLLGVGTAAVAMGNLIAQGVQAGVNALLDLGREALDAVASYERLGMALEAMVGRFMVSQGEAGSLAEAQAAAASQSQELLGWIQKLAIQSPFNQDNIASAFKLSMAYGFSADEAKRLVQAQVDFAAATGSSGPTMERIALAMGQIAARGKLMGGELLQLSQAGLGQKAIFDELSKSMGKSTEELQDMQSKGLIPARHALEAITKVMEQYQGAAARQTNTFSGLIASLGDLKEIVLRTFSEGTFAALKKPLIQLVDALQDPAVLAQIKAAGERLGQAVQTALDTVQAVVSGFKVAGVGGAATALLQSLGLDDKLASTAGAVVSDMADAIRSGLALARQAFADARPYVEMFANGLVAAAPVIVGIAATLGSVLMSALSAVAVAVQFVAQHWQVFAVVLGVVAAILVGGAIASGLATLVSVVGGLAAVVASAGGVIGFLTTGLGILAGAIGALLSPLGLVLAAIVAFGFAWSNNWGGIQDIAFRVVAQVQALLGALAGTFGAIGNAIRVALTDGPSAGLAAYQNSMSQVDVTYQQQLANLDQRGAELKAGFANAWDGAIGTIQGKLGEAFNVQDNGLLAMVANAQQRAAEIRLAMAGAQGLSLAQIDTSFTQGQVTAGMERDLVKAEATGRSLTKQAKVAGAAIAQPAIAFNTAMADAAGKAGGGGAGKAAKTVEDNIKEAAEVIRSVTDTVLKLKDFLSGGKLSELRADAQSEEIVQVAMWMTNLGLRMAQGFRDATAAWKEEGNKAASAAAEAIGSATKSVGDVAGMLVKLGDLMKHDKWPEMQANMGRVQEIAAQLLMFGLGLAQVLVPAAQGMSEEAAKSAQYMGQAIQAAAQAVTAVADLLPKLWAFTELPEFDEIMASRGKLQEVAGKLILWGRDLAKSFVAAAKGFSEDAAKASQNLATAIQSATSSVTQVLDLIPKLLAFQSDPGLMAVLNDSEQRAAILQIARQLIAFGALLARDFAAAGKGLKEKAVVEAKRLADIIGSASTGLTAVDTAIRLLLGIMSDQSYMALLNDQSALAQVRQVARWLGSLARVLGEDWANAGRSLAAVTVTIAQRLTDGIKATNDGLQAAFGALSLLIDNSARLFNVISQPEAFFNALRGLTIYLARLALFLTNDWANAGRLLSSVSVGTATRLSDGIKATNDGMQAAVGALALLIDNSARLFNVIGQPEAFFNYLRALTIYLGRLAVFLANDWARAGTQLDTVSATHGPALSNAIKATQEGIASTLAALQALLGASSLLARVAGQGEAFESYLINVTRWLASLAVWLSNEWDIVGNSLDTVSSTHGPALTNAIKTTQEGLAAILDALDQLTRQRNRIAAWMGQGEAFGGYLVSLTGWLASLAVWLSNEWDIVGNSLDTVSSVHGPALTDAIRSTADGLTATLDAIETLVLQHRRIDRLAAQGPALTDYLVALTGWLAGLAALLAGEWGRVAAQLDSAVTGPGAALTAAVSTVRDGLGAVVDSLDTLLLYRRRIDGLARQGEPLLTYLTALTGWLAGLGVLLSNEWGRVASLLDQAATGDGAALADAVSTVSGGIGSVLDATDSLLLYRRRLDSLMSQGQPLLDYLAAMTGWLGRLGAQLANTWNTTADQLDQALVGQGSALADAVSSVAGGLQDTYDAARALVDIGQRGLPAVDLSLVTSLVTLARSLVTQALAAVGAWQADSAVQAAFSDLADGLSSFAGLMDDVLGVAQAFFDKTRLLSAAFGTDGLPLAGLTTFAANSVRLAVALVGAVQSLVGQIDGVVLDSLSQLGDAIGSLSSALSDTVAVVALYFDTVYGGGQWATWTDQLLYSDTMQMFLTAWAEKVVALAEVLRRAAVAALAAVDPATLAAFQQASDNYGNLGDVLGGLGDALSSTLGIVTTYFDTVNGGGQWSAWVDQMLYSDTMQMFLGEWIKRVIALAQGLRAAANEAIGTINRDGIDSLTNLGDSLSALSGVTSDTLGILQAYLDAIENKLPYSDGEVQSRVASMVGSLVAFGLVLRRTGYQALIDAGATTIEAIPAMSALGTALSDLSGVTGSVLDIFRAYMAALDDKVQYRDSEVRARVQAMVGGLVAFGLVLRSAGYQALIDAQVTTLQAIPVLGTLGTILSDLSNVTGSVLDLFRAYMAAIDDKVQYSDSQVQASVRRMVGVLVAFGLTLRNEALAALTQAQVTVLEAIPALGALGTVLSDLSNVTGSVLDLFRTYMDALKDKVPYRDGGVRAAVVGLARDMVAFGLDLRDAAVAALAARDIAQLEASPALQTLADTLSNVTSIVSDALDLSKLSRELASYKPISVAGVVNARVEQVIADAIAVARLFAQRVADSGLTEEVQKASEQASSVISSAFGGLTSGLDFFSKLFGNKGDEAAFIPSPGQLQAKVTAILDLIRSVAAQWQTGITGLAGEEGQAATESAQAVEAVFGGFSSVVDAIRNAAELNLGTSGFNNITFLINFIDQTVQAINKAFSQGSEAAVAMAGIVSMLEDIGDFAGVTVGESFVEGMARAIRAGGDEVQAALSDLFGGGKGDAGAGAAGQGSGSRAMGSGSGVNVTIHQYVTAEMVLDPKATVLQIKDALA